jgi:hypothetical protein
VCVGYDKEAKRKRKGKEKKEEAENGADRLP